MPELQTVYDADNTPFEVIPFLAAKLVREGWTRNPKGAAPVKAVAPTVQEPTPPIEPPKPVLAKAGRA